MERARVLGSTEGGGVLEIPAYLIKMPLLIRIYLWMLLSTFTEMKRQTNIQLRLNRKEDLLHQLLQLVKGFLTERLKHMSKDLLFIFQKDGKRAIAKLYFG